MNRPKHTDGRPYEGNQQYAGNGLQRSCDKCGKHFSPGLLRKHPKLPIKVCEGCRK